MFRSIAEHYISLLIALKQYFINSGFTHLTALTGRLSSFVVMAIFQCIFIMINKLIMDQPKEAAVYSKVY